MRKFFDLTGKRFGRWTVLKRAENAGGRVRYVCLCDCGERRKVLAQNLTNGRSESCGCSNREKAASRMQKQATTHGESKTRLYSTWKAMRVRCNAKNGRDVKLYSGRGIKVCEEWNKFEPFRDWAMSHGYRDDLEIDRIDNNGNYEPSNCRWATRTEQVRNRQNTYTETINGETKSVAEWCEIFGYPYYIGSSRHQRGIPLDKPYKSKKRSSETSGPH